MKTIIFIFAMFLASSTIYAQDNEGINFFDGTFEQALEKARSENKLMLVDCYTQWCGPCKVMDSHVFPTKEVGDFVNPLFVFLKLDMENGEGPELDKTLNVEAYPTYVILNQDGEEITRFTGYRQPDAFIAAIRAGIDPSQNLESLRARYNAGERDKAFMRDYSSLLAAARREQEAQTIVKEMIGSLTDEEKLLSEYWNYWTRYNYASPGSEGFDFLVSNRHKFEVGEDAVTLYLLNAVRNAYVQIGFTPGGRPGAEELDRVNELAQTLGLSDNAAVRFFSAAADARVNGTTIDKMIDVLTSVGDTVFSEEEQNSILVNIAYSFNGDLSESQQERLISLATDEKTKEKMDAIKRSVRGL